MPALKKPKKKLIRKSKPKKPANTNVALDIGTVLPHDERKGTFHTVVYRSANLSGVRVFQCPTKAAAITYAKGIQSLIHVVLAITANKDWVEGDGLAWLK